MGTVLNCENVIMKLKSFIQAREERTKETKESNKALATAIQSLVSKVTGGNLGRDGKRNVEVNPFSVAGGRLIRNEAGQW